MDSSNSLAIDDFTAYGTSHQVVLVMLGVGAVALVWFGRSHREDNRAERFGRGLAVAILAFTVPMQILQVTPGYWRLSGSLPIQVCDLAWMAAAYALWTHRHWAIALTYFWGLTLTTQAVITPELSAEFPQPGFFMYWGMHLLVVWAAIYLTFGLGLFPDWRSYRIAITATAVWAVTIFAFNTVVGTNYGYLNAKPRTPSVLDLMGPWPWYILVEVAIVSVAWALITWPWVAVARRRRPAHPAPDAVRGSPNDPNEGGG